MATPAKAGSGNPPYLSAQASATVAGKAASVANSVMVERIIGSVREVCDEAVNRIFGQSEAYRLTCSIICKELR